MSKKLHLKKKVQTKQENLKPVAAILQTRPKSSNRNDIIEWLMFTGLVDNYIKKLEYADVDSETLQDMIQEVWLFICEIEQTKWDQLYYQGATAIKAYISGLIYRHIHSNTSLIYKKYKKPYLYFKRISDDAWDVFDETNTMQPHNDDYITKENDLDIIKRQIEMNQYNND